ncbi:MAG: DNA repair protein RecO [Fidelibacterota bacterium]
MGLIKTEALLLKKVNFRDSSTIIQFYTRDEGRVSIIAKGSRQIKSQYRGYLEPLTHLSIIYYDKPTREIQTLGKVDMIQNFVKDSRNVVATYHGLAILELINKMVHHNEENQKLFQLTIHSLQYIDRYSEESNIGLIVFLLHAIKTLGYQIDFEHCQFCGHELRSFYFEENNPQPVCAHCAGRHYDNITGEQLNWLRVINALNTGHPFQKIMEIKGNGKIINFLLCYAGMYFDFYPKLNSLELLRYF